MNQKIKTISTIIIILFILSFILSPSIEARSGCCSWHGGVCTYQCPDGINMGYKCCDGTSLSVKCAPYYSKCPPYTSKPKSEPKPEPKPEQQPEPEPKSEASPVKDTSQPKPDSETSLQKSYTAAVSDTQQKEKSYSWIWWIIGIMVIGGIAYNYGKKRKEKF